MYIQLTKAPKHTEAATPDSLPNFCRSCFPRTHPSARRGGFRCSGARGHHHAGGAVAEAWYCRSIRAVRIATSTGLLARWLARLCEKFWFINWIGEAEIPSRLFETVDTARRGLISLEANTYFFKGFAVVAGLEALRSYHTGNGLV